MLTILIMDIDLKQMSASTFSMSPNSFLSPLGFPPRFTINKSERAIEICSITEL